jgi:glycosyltransferase involved in cell wall biosynthesis
MRVSIINLNLVGQDAIGGIILDQLHFFRRNGDEVQIYTLHPPVGVDDDAAAAVRVVTAGDLIAQRDEHFASSDLYVYHYPSRHPLMESIKTLSRGAVILYFHNVTPPDLWEEGEEREQLRASLEGVSVLASYADLVVALSEYSAEQLVNDHGVDPDRVRVLPPAVPLDQFSPGPKPPALLEEYGLAGKEIILYVGRMAGNKRIDLLVDALAQVRREVPNAVLMLVGDKDGNPSFQAITAAAQTKAADLGVADAVTFTGRVDDLPDYYRLADVYATASLHEGFGVPLLEAMASGTPVVASNVTAHPSVLGDAGLLAEPGDAADLARKITDILRHDARYGELVQRGLERARNFSLEAYWRGWADVIHEATQWLPQAAYPGPVAITGDDKRRFRRQYIDVEAIGSLLDDDLRQLESKAEVVDHAYAVRSQLPVIGPFIAWLRRNLTSHLKEPYVDPTFGKQEAFNWQTVQTMQIMAAQLTRAQIDPAEFAAMQERIEVLEQQVAELQSKLAQTHNVNHS